MKPSEFPIEVKRGSVTVRIRRACPSKKYPDYFVFVLDYHEDGKRQRPSFAALKEARHEAEAVAERIARGDSKTLVLSGSDRLSGDPRPARHRQDLHCVAGHHGAGGSRQKGRGVVQQPQGRGQPAPCLRRGNRREMFHNNSRRAFALLMSHLYRLHSRGLV